MREERSVQGGHWLAGDEHPNDLVQQELIKLDHLVVLKIGWFLTRGL